MGLPVNHCQPPVSLLDGEKVSNSRSGIYPGLGLFIVQNGNNLDGFMLGTVLDSFDSSGQTPTQGRLISPLFSVILVSPRVSKRCVL